MRQFDVLIKWRMVTVAPLSALRRLENSWEKTLKHVNDAMHVRFGMTATRFVSLFAHSESYQMPNAISRCKELPGSDCPDLIVTSDKIVLAFDKCYPRLEIVHTMGDYSTNFRSF
jgi:hypothetical protein